MPSQLCLETTLYDYILEHSIHTNPFVQALREQTATMPEHKMMSTPIATQFLCLLVELMTAKRIIEVGVYTGATTLAMAQALPPDGEIIACDHNAHWASIGQKYWEKAGVIDKIKLKIGDAKQTLQSLEDPNNPPNIDLIFIDANKVDYPQYLELSLPLLRPGGLLVFDNALWGGKVANPNETDVNVKAIRYLLDQLHIHPRLCTSLIPVADGLALAVKRRLKKIAKEPVFP